MVSLQITGDICSFLKASNSPSSIVNTISTTESQQLFCQKYRKFAFPNVPKLTSQIEIRLYCHGFTPHDILPEYNVRFTSISQFKIRNLRSSDIQAVIGQRPSHMNQRWYAVIWSLVFQWETQINVECANQSHSTC